MKQNKPWTERRDEAADKYELEVSCIDGDLEAAFASSGFAKGADWARRETLKDMHVIMELLLRIRARPCNAKEGCPCCTARQAIELFEKMKGQKE